MNRKLNIDSFNGILMKHLPAESRKDLLEVELKVAYSLKIEVMEDLVECLNNGDAYEGVLQKINNIDSACDKIGKMLKACAEAKQQRKYRQ